MRSISVAFLLLACSSSFAQTTWVHTYGSAGADTARCVIVAPGGGFVVAGQTSPFGVGSSDMYVLWLDENGDTLWTRTYGTGAVDGAQCIAPTTDGGYIVAGGTRAVPYESVWLVKITAAGDTVWSHTYPDADGTWGYSVRQTPDGGYVVAGSKCIARAGETCTDSDVLVIKTDSLGAVVWTRSYNWGGAIHYARSVCETADGGYAVACYKELINSWPTLIKLDADGDTVWTRSYAVLLAGVAQTADSGLVAAGTDAGATYPNLYVVKTNAGGDPQWSFECTLDDRTRSWGVEATPDGGCIATGSYRQAGFKEAYLLRMSATGDSLWSRTYGGSQGDEAFSVSLTTDGGFIFAGVTREQGESTDDVYVVRTDSSGVVGVREEGAAIPRGFAVETYPNPFNAATRVSFSLLESDDVSLIAYDILGRKVATLHDGPFPAGEHSITWDAGDLPSGAYFVRLVQGENVATTKVVLLK